jgi:hypothetical protein
VRGVAQILGAQLVRGIATAGGAERGEQSRWVSATASMSQMNVPWSSSSSDGSSSRGSGHNWTPASSTGAAMVMVAVRTS